MQHARVVRRDLDCGVRLAANSLAHAVMCTSPDHMLSTELTCSEVTSSYCRHAYVSILTGSGGIQHVQRHA